jgi:hypothetical protein
MKLLALVLSLALITPAYAGGEAKQVCHDKLDKSGKVVKDKKGNTVQDCKTIKVHKKLDGATVVPTKK